MLQRTILGTVALLGLLIGSAASADDRRYYSDHHRDSDRGYYRNDPQVRLGIDVITSGNHIWDKKDVIGYIPKESRLLRPLNYPPGAPGYGTIVVTARGGTKVAVLNVSGRVFMNDFDCPFRTTLAEIETIARVLED